MTIDKTKSQTKAAGQSGPPYKGGVLSVRSGMPCGQVTVFRDMSDLSGRFEAGEFREAVAWMFPS